MALTHARAQLGYTAIGFSTYRQIVIDQSLDSLLSSPDTYANFEFLSWAQSAFNDISAVLLFFVWIKVSCNVPLSVSHVRVQVFKYISFNKTMTQLSSTLSRSAKDVAGFSIMFFIIFGAYAQLGFLLFGDKVCVDAVCTLLCVTVAQNPDYQSFYKSVFTLLRLILCDFDYLTLTLCSPVLGPIYFLSYVLLCFFVLLVCVPARAHAHSRWCRTCSLPSSTKHTKPSRKNWNSPRTNSKLATCSNGYACDHFNIRSVCARSSRTTTCCAS